MKRAKSPLITVFVLDWTCAVNKRSCFKTFGFRKVVSAFAGNSLLRHLQRLKQDAFH